MQTNSIQKAKLGETVDGRGGFRCTVNGAPALLPSSQFSNPPGQTKAEWAAKFAGTEVDVIFTGASVVTEDQGTLPVVSARGLGKNRREELAKRLDALVQQKAGRATSATVSKIVAGMRLHVEVDGRKARPFREPISLVILKNQVDAAVFDQLCARVQVGSKIQVVLRPSRVVGTSIYLEAGLPVK